jgi:dTDP-4-dehydrorhamnose 3,5-epimerase-like enzyme
MSQLEQAKKVITRDANGSENGWLLELFKDKEAGNKTEVYLTATKPGSFKGYHLHRIRTGRFIALKGKVRIIMYAHNGAKWMREEAELDAAAPQRIIIPANTATGLETIGSEEAWLVNYPDPAYDPSIKDEQVEYTQLELEAGIVKL